MNQTVVTPTTAQTVERFFVHVLLIGLGAIFMFLEQWVTGHNFGAYQSLAVAVNAILFTAIEKFFTDQGITLPAGTTLSTTAPVEQAQS